MDVNPLLCTFPLPTSEHILVVPRTQSNHSAPAAALTRTTFLTELPPTAWLLPAHLLVREASLHNRALVVAVEAVVVQ